MSRPFKEVFYENYRSSHATHLYGDTSREGFKRWHANWLYYFGNQFPTNKDAKILDIGCGEGAFVDFLHGLGYKNTEGVDLSPEQIDLGTKLGISNLSVADLTELLPKHPGEYDLIIARDVLEHFTRQAAFEMLIAVNEALKPGGKFIIQVPNGQGLFYTSIYWGDCTHEAAYTETSLRQIFTNTGFKSSTCFPMGPAPVTLKGKFRYFIWNMKVAQTRFWKAVEMGSSAGIFTANVIAVGEK